MIYIATIHWKTDRWIDIQQKYLARNMTDNYRVFAYLDGVGKENNDNFYFTINQPLSDHGKKLNILTDAIIHDSKDENDIVIFLDGDAFPIDDLTD